jgi:hypothetical protein
MTRDKLFRPMLLAALAVCASGCVVHETRPLPQLQAVQATEEIPDELLLDVGIRLFDPGIPEGLEDDPQKIEKTRIYPEIRRAEARYMPNQLRDTLEGTAQWGAVRVVPGLVEAMDVIVTGRIIESTAAELKLAIRAQDSTGRVWLEKTYEGAADTRAYRQGGAGGRDPFENVYVNIANDLLAARQKLTADDVRTVQLVSEVRFAAGFAPAAFGDYLVRDRRSGRYQLTRLPAEGDPVFERVNAIRERDDALVDTVSDGYAAFSDRLTEAYGNYRRFSYDEIVAEDKLKAQARTRIALGALAVAAGVLVPDSCSSSDCARVVDAARYGAIAGGVYGVMSGIKKGEESKMHTATLREFAGSFQNEAEPLVVEIEGRTLRLTGTAEEQYAEWRRLLHELYEDDTGLAHRTPAVGAAASPPAPAKPGPG